MNRNNAVVKYPNADGYENNSLQEEVFGGEFFVSCCFASVSDDKYADNNQQ